MSRTYSFNWAANHGIVFTHTHTPRFQQFCSPQSGPTLVKVKPGEFPASTPEATSLAFRFWDAGSGRGRLRLSPRCTSFVASSAAGASRPCLAATVLAYAPEMPLAAPRLSPFLSPAWPPSEPLPSSSQTIPLWCKPLIPSFQPLPHWAISRDSTVGSLSPQSQLSHYCSSPTERPRFQSLL